MASNQAISPVAADPFSKAVSSMAKKTFPRKPARHRMPALSRCLLVSRRSLLGGISSPVTN
jgi:hypothetical protein